MKQPKFRGFNKETSKWHYGHGWFEISRTEEVKKEKNVNDRAFLCTDYGLMECEMGSLSQYTGLNDINQKEIYGQDFVKNLKGNISEITWDEEEFAFMAKSFNKRGEDSTISLADLNAVATIAVCGNTYENKEMTCHQTPVANHEQAVISMIQNDSIGLLTDFDGDVIIDPSLLL